MTVRDRAPWLVGAVLGAVVVLLVLPALRVDAAPAPPAGALHVTAQSTGEVAVRPTGTVLRTADLRAGGSDRAGEVTIVNQTARVLRIRARVSPVGDELDGLVSVRIRAGTTPLGTQLLRSRAGWPRESIVLRPLEQRRLDVVVSPTSRSGADLAGLEADARLDLRSEVVR
ncbi:MAG: hypothetical protein JHC84_02605 [Solirubrobacteraceae bacterium]|nr:hypothetical protein [Solirubrobacteraceae bacterium]